MPQSWTQLIHIGTFRNDGTAQPERFPIAQTVTVDCAFAGDGETIDSCIYLAVWAEGKNIRTLEGLEKNGELTRIQEAFIEEGAIQCGFCTPGFIMSATVLLEHGEKLSRDAIRKHMAGNLCRCTGYENIVNAVEKVMDENETRRGKTVR